LRPLRPRALTARHGPSPRQDVDDVGAADVVEVVDPLPAAVVVVVVVEPLPATVVDVVDDVDDVDDVDGAIVVLGSVVVAIPVGS
jgi:hypothetical protein